MVRRRSPVRFRPSAPQKQEPTKRLCFCGCRRRHFVVLSSFCGAQVKIVSASVAQLVEHLIRNEEVAGSIPAAGSSFIKKNGRQRRGAALALLNIRKVLRKTGIL